MYPFEFTYKLKTIIPFWFFCGLLTWWVSGNCFFWDTVQLASKHAHWYYEQNFQHFLLPENIDSGHPPYFGIYLALCWKVFGKSLMVSHFAMLPFLLGIIWLLYEIGLYYGNTRSAKYLIILILVDPFYAGQSILVSPDIVLIFAFLLSLNGVLKERTIPIMVGVILLGLISMRGMMVGLSLYFWWVYISLMNQNISWLNLKQIAIIFTQKLIPFLPGGIIALVFLFYHYQTVGWIGYHLNSPWAGSFQEVNFSGFIRNIGILGWRFLDYGRIFLLLGLIWIFWQIPKTKDTIQRPSLFSLFVILLLIITPSLLLHKGLLSHRYLLPITLTITFLFYHLCFSIISSKSIQKIIFSIAFLGLLTGNFWIYPKQIAQGWDATLAHLPYYDLRQKMIQYIDNETIPYGDIGTVFPNIGPFEIYDLNGRQTGFVKKDFTKNNYFLYATVFNDITDGELLRLASNWQLIKSYEASGLAIILYQKKEHSDD